MILHSKIDKVSTVPGYYAVYTTELYRDYDKDEYNNEYEDVPEMTVRYCTYLFKTSHDLIKFMDLHKYQVFLECLDQITYAYDNHYNKHNIVEFDEDFGKRYDYFRYLWNQNGIHAIEAYREFLRERANKRHEYEKEVSYLEKEIDRVSHEKDEFWDEDLGPSPRECALRDDYEDLISNPPKDIKVDLKKDGKYYLNEERCSPEGFVYKPEEKEKKEKTVDSNVSFDEIIPF